MYKTRKGFTLIELLVAISIVAVLSAIGMVNFLGSQKRGRDVRRQSDLSQYRIALENYSSVMGGSYPVSTAGVASAVLAGPLAAYMSGFPADTTSTTYRYVSDGTLYVLDACMEAGASTLLFEMCSNGKSGTTALGCATAIDTGCDL